MKTGSFWRKSIPTPFSGGDLPEYDEQVRTYRLTVFNSGGAMTQYGEPGLCPDHRSDAGRRGELLAGNAGRGDPVKETTKPWDYASDVDLT